MQIGSPLMLARNVGRIGYKSSAVSEMGDRDHNRHGLKRGGGSAVPFRGAAWRSWAFD